MWLINVLLVILPVMLISGIAMLGHVINTSHSYRDLRTVIPVSTIGIVGMIQIVDHILALVVDLTNSEPTVSTYQSIVQHCYLNINVVIVVLLWRSVSMSAMAASNRLYVFIVFATSVLGVLSLNAAIHPDQRASVMMSSLHPELFAAAPVESYMYGLCVEYLAFYIPSFCLMARLWNTRPGHTSRDAVVNDGYMVRQPDAECVRCANMSPYLDLVGASIAVLVLIVRPLYILYYWLTVRVVMDLRNDYVILPVYFATCLVSFQLRTNRTTLPVTCKGEKCVLDLTESEKPSHVHWPS